MQILGYIIRLAYFLKERSVWGDSMWMIETCDLSWRDMWCTMATDVHPPVAFIFYKLFHYMVVPFVAGIVSLWLVTYLTKDKLIWLLFGISPYFLQLTGEARGYGLLLMFSLMVLRWSWAFPLAVFTEHYGLFASLWVKWKRWMWWIVLGSIGIIALQMGTEQALAPNRGFDWSAISIVKKAVGLFLQWGGGVGYSFLTKTQATHLGVSNTLLILAHLSPLPLLWWARDKKMWKMLVIPVVLLFIFYPIRLNARYLPFCSVAYLWLIVDGYRRCNWRGLANTLICVYISANLFSLAWMFTLKCDPYHREDYITATRIVSGYAQKGDGIVDDRFYSFYHGKKLKYNGGVWWEIYQGNPELSTNVIHWNLQLMKLGKRKYEVEKISDLTWVVRYE